MKMRKFALAAVMSAFACSSVFAQQGAPKGAAVDPSADEQKALDALKGKVKGVIAWSTSRANSQHDIWLMNADGTNAHALTNSGNVDWFPRISPDGTKILFNRSKGGWVPENDANYPEKWELWTMNMDGSDQTKVVDNATWGTWRPDGKTIVFSRAGKVFTKALDNNAETLILDGESAFNKSGVILQEPNMSPDGKHLAITLRGSMRETGVWDLEKNSWTKSGDGCQIDWNFDGSKLYRVNPTGNGGTAAPSEILWFSAKDGKQVEKVGFFGIPKNVKLMDLPGRRSHEYFPRISPDGQWLVWGATDKGHDHDMFDYELYMWKIGEPVETATRITYHSGNDRWPDIWLGKVPASAPAAGTGASENTQTANASAGAVVGSAELVRAIVLLSNSVQDLTEALEENNKAEANLARMRAAAAYAAADDAFAAYDAMKNAANDEVNERIRAKADSAYNAADDEFAAYEAMKEAANQLPEVKLKDVNGDKRPDVIVTVGKNVYTFIQKKNGSLELKSTEQVK